MRIATLVHRAATCLWALLLVPEGALGETASAAVAAPAHRDGALALEDAVREGLDHNADGDYEAADAVWARLGEAFPAHPAPDVHAVDTLYWREVHVDDASVFDEQIRVAATEAVEKASAFAEHRSRDAVAQMYLGQALIQLGRYHGMRLRVVKAGGLGERGRKALEQALRLEPDLADSRFPLGLYAYYAGQLPNLLSWLRFLWFVPEGDVEGGLRDLETARRNGDRYDFDASFFLTNIRAYHDGARDEAWALREAQALHAAHPRNALVHFELLELLAMQDEYEVVRLEAAKLEAHPAQETSAEARGRANMGRVWRARAELALGDPDRAWGTLAVFGDDGPAEPDWGSRWVQVTRGQILDAKGHRDEAVEQYERVDALDLDPDSRALAEAQAGLAAPPAISAPPPKLP